MKNGFRIRWTDNALKELEETFTFLETNWTEKNYGNYQTLSIKP